MKYTISFIITLVLVSGFIAYFGDILGRRMGKRRLTLFGMRPRHTAIVVTTITGMLIATLTLATMIGVSSQLRYVLIAGERMIGLNRSLIQKNSSLRQESSRLRKQGDELNALLVAKISEERKAARELEEARGARDDAKRRVDQLSLTIKSHLLQLEELKNSRAATEQRLAELEKQLLDRQAELETKTRELEARQTELEIADSELIEVQNQVEALGGEIARQAQQIEEQRRTLVRQELDFAWLYGEMRDYDIKFRKGEELARKVVSPGSYYAVRGELLDLLEAASQVALDRGAIKHQNNRAVRLITADRPTGIIERDERQCLDNWAQTISRSLQSVVVLVVASGNTLAREQAMVEFRPYHNRLVYKKGALIARAMKATDGTMSEGRILAEVVSFLQNDVRLAADRAGVVPVANTEPQIKGDQLDELLEVVERIRTLNCMVEIRAVAEQDITAAGPLDLRTMDFIILPLAVKDK